MTERMRRLLYRVQCAVGWKVRATVSADGLYFYFDKVWGLRAHSWLGLAKLSGPVPEDKRNTGVFEPQRLEVRKKGGEVYHRLVYGFSFFKIKSGREPIRIPVASDEYADFVCLHRPGGRRRP